MNIPEEYPAQIRLVLDLILPSYLNLSVTPQQARLLKLDNDYPQSDDIWNACKDVVAETIITIMRALPDPETRFDMESPEGYALTHDLLQRIADSPGRALPPAAVKLPDPVLAFLVENGVVARGLNGLAWGRNAGTFLRRYEQRGKP